jgi:hypothetical protein
MNFKEFDTVILKEPLVNKKVRVGSLGVIIEILDKDVFLVEFADKNGVAYAIEALQTKQLMKVYEEPVLV